MTFTGKFLSLFKLPLAALHMAGHNSLQLQFAMMMPQLNGLTHIFIYILCIYIDTISLALSFNNLILISAHDLIIF